MRYYATASTDRVRNAMRMDLLGQIITPAAGNRLEPGVDWCADNGIYSRAYPGDAAYLGWLRTHADYRSRCRFAVAPDVVADHWATMARSEPMLTQIRAIVGRVAICAQNGADVHTMPWDLIDVVFLAGIVECVACRYVPRVEDLPESTCPAGHPLVEWKLGATAAAIAAEARRRGLWVHMGRVNSKERLDYATSIGCNSADGTYLAFGPDANLPVLLSWLDPADPRFPAPHGRRRSARVTPSRSRQGGLFDAAVR